MTKILLVDDYDETLESLSLLYNLNSDVEIVGVAHNSKEIWHILAKHKVDIVSLDIQLGSEDGIYLCGVIHQQYPDVFIVMCSVEASEIYQRLSLGAGASCFLAKPLSKDDIRNTLASYTRSNQPDTETHALTDQLMDDLLGSS